MNRTDPDLPPGAPTPRGEPALPRATAARPTKVGRRPWAVYLVVADEPGIGLMAAARRANPDVGKSYAYRVVGAALRRRLIGSRPHPDYPRRTVLYPRPTTDWRV